MIFQSLFPMPTEKCITFHLSMRWDAHPFSEHHDWTLILQKSAGACVYETHISLSLILRSSSVHVVKELTTPLNRCVLADSMAADRCN